MKNLLTLILLFTVSSVWAQEGTVPAGSQATALETPMVNVTAVVQGNSWGSAAPAAVSTGVTPVAASPQQTVVDNGTAQVSPTDSSTVVPSGTTVPVSTATAMVGTPVAGTVSASATPSASSTPSVMPKPPMLAMVTPVMTTTVGEHFVFQADGGAVMPVSSSAATYFGTGFNFDLGIAYAFDDVFSVGLQTGFYSLPVPTSSLQASGIPTSAMASVTHIPLLFTMQIYFGDSGAPVQPFLLLAGGLALDSANLQGASFPATAITSWTNFELDPAVGVAFRLDKNTNIFVQTRLDMDFDDYTSTDAAVQSGDTPIILVPVQVGLNLNL